jgi:hypothetical protein
VIIDDYKEDICGALENYSRQLDDPKKEMDQSTNAAQRIEDNNEALDRRDDLGAWRALLEMSTAPASMKQCFVSPC